jgi:hypothetical protein
MKKNIYLLICLAGLAGCASLDDFKKMSPADRARKVCDSKAAGTNKTIESYIAQTKEINAALARGYRIHKVCVEVEKKGPPSVICSKSANGAVNCEQSTPRRHETVCTESPVALSYELEKDKLNSLKALIAETDSRRVRDWQACYERVLVMSPEQAYEEY